MRSKLNKVIPYIFIIILVTIVCFADYSGTLNENVLKSTLISVDGIGEVTATKVYECLKDSNIVRMNIRNPIVDIVKSLSLFGIAFISLILIRKDIKKLNEQSYDGHKNTQEFLLEVYDELEKDRK